MQWAAEVSPGDAKTGREAPAIKAAKLLHSVTRLRLHGRDTVECTQGYRCATADEKSAVKPFSATMVNNPSVPRLQYVAIRRKKEGNI